MSGRYAARDAANAARAVRDILESSRDNGVCADCSSPNPEFLNLTIGTFVCEQCADVHRSSSNRRIKDMLGPDLNADDVRRMRDVGNEVANRRFLARWNPNEFPEPDPNDKELLREFIWLKYEGSWKPVVPAPGSQPSRRVQRDYTLRAPPERPYSDEAEYDRGHRHYREPPRAADPPGRPSYWASRFGHAVSDPHSDRSGVRERVRDTEYNRGDRYHQARLSAAPPSGSGYRRRAPPPRSSAYGGPSLDEEYASADVGSYREADRRSSSSRPQERRSNRVPAASYKKSSGGRRRRVKSVSSASETDDSEYYSSSDGADGSDGKREKGRDQIKRRGRENEKYLKRHAKRTVVESGTDSNEDSDGSATSSRRGKKASSSSAPGRKKREKQRRAKNAASDPEESSGESDGEGRSSTREAAVSRRDGTKKGGGVANPFASDGEGASQSLGTASTSPNRVQSAGVTGEFDLMSEWMGTETDATTTSGSISNAASVQPGVPSASIHPGQQSMPPMMPPMSVYPGMVPMPLTMFPPQGGMMMSPGMYQLPMHQPPLQFQPQLSQFPGQMQPPPPQMMNPLVSGMHNMFVQPPVQQTQPSPMPPPPPPPQSSNEALDSNQLVPPRPEGPPPPE